MVSVYWILIIPITSTCWVILTKHIFCNSFTPNVPTCDDGTTNDLLTGAQRPYLCASVLSKEHWLRANLAASQFDESSYWFITWAVSLLSFFFVIWQNKYFSLCMSKNHSLCIFKGVSRIAHFFIGNPIFVRYLP